MSLVAYLHLFLRRAWILVLAVLLTAGAAFAFSRAQTPEYRASQRVAIQPARNDFGLVETLRILLRSYVEYLYTDLRAQEVINRLQLDMTAGQLRSRATINSDPTTLIIRIDVDLEDPTLAAQIANTWGQLLVEFRNQSNSDLRREDRIEAELLDYPVPSQSQPNTRTNVLAAVVLGLLLGGALIFALEFWQANLLRSPEDIKRWLGAPVIGAIPLDVRGEG
jgi:capsular polysaccharide biosynthesis protein